MDDCEKYRELISRMIDGELDDCETADVMAHIASCPECRKLYAAFSGVSGVIGGDLDDPPKELSAGVMAAVGGKKKKAAAFRRAERILAAAACLALVVAAAAKFGMFGGTSDTAVSAKSAAAPRSTTVQVSDSAAPEDSQQPAESQQDKNETTSAQQTSASPSEQPAAGIASSNDAVSPAAYIIGPDGSASVSDAELISQLSSLLAKPADANTLIGGTGMQTSNEYTITMPDGETLGVNTDGDSLICEDTATGEKYAASGSAADFTELMGKIYKAG